MNAVIKNIKPIFRDFSKSSYEDMHMKMHDFTDQRNADTQDEIWFVEHEPVLTLGRNGNQNNVLVNSNIPIVHSDRGGDVTYHGPGQLVVYCLIDLKRLQLGVKQLVAGLEQLVIDYLSVFEVTGHRINSAPGIYVDGAKIASLGLRVRHGCSFHGLALNVDMDLKPFAYIHPCGLEGMQVTQLSSLGIQVSCNEVALQLTELINQQFYTNNLSI